MKIKIFFDKATFIQAKNESLQQQKVINFSRLVSKYQ
jgi:hypothetical protein